MKLLRVASLILVFFIVYTSTSETANKNGTDTVESQWKQFKIDFKRNYTTSEDVMRLELFKETLEQIKEHNEKYEMGKAEVPATLNEYSDWTDDEKRKLLA